VPLGDLDDDLDGVVELFPVPQRRLVPLAEVPTTPDTWYTGATASLKFEAPGPRSRPTLAVCGSLETTEL
jgi:hypothetical protein